MDGGYIIYCNDIWNYKIPLSQKPQHSSVVRNPLGGASILPLKITEWPVSGLLLRQEERRQNPITFNLSHPSKAWVRVSKTEHPYICGFLFLDNTGQIIDTGKLHERCKNMKQIQLNTEQVIQCLSPDQTSMHKRHADVHVQSSGSLQWFKNGSVSLQFLQPLLLVRKTFQHYSRWINCD